ncbi:MAG: hypothetical protein AAFR36_24890 [Bacteroidota bacterium]
MGLFAFVIFWALFFLSALYWVPKLFLNYFHRKKLLSRLVSENDWTLNQTSTPNRPTELVDETFSNIAADDDDYYKVDVALRINGKHRGRDFFLMTYSQRMRKRRNSEASGSTYIFTRIQDESAFPPMFMHINSKIFEGFMAVDSAAKASSGKLRAFPVVSMPSPFTHKYSVRGLKGTRDFLTQEIQEKILKKPHLFLLSKEKWYRRFGVIPGLTERYAYVDIQDLNPITLVNRMDSLMDWADIVDSRNFSRGN